MAQADDGQDPRAGRYLRRDEILGLFRAEGIEGYRACAPELGLSSTAFCRFVAKKGAIPLTRRVEAAVRNRFPAVPAERLFEERWEVTDDAAADRAA